jgi:glycosyltransferase involved in cell wall biosynthesis
MQQMKKILFLTPTLPYPPVSGGVIKSSKVVQFLSERYELTVACLLKNEDKSFKVEFHHKTKLKNLITLELNIPRSAKNLLISNLQHIPLNLYRNKSKTFKDKIQGLANGYDVIFCDHYVMFQYIPEDYKGRVVLHQHNCEYLIWQRYAAIEKNWLKKLALYHQAGRIRKYEQEICKNATAVLAAPNDTDELVKIGADRTKFYETYHLGDDQLLEQPDLTYEQTELVLLYIGTLSWEANIDGLVWFNKEIWPQLKANHPGIKWVIIGKHADGRLKEIAKEDNQVELTGFVEDVEPYFRKSRVFITPLRFGSGIKVKVINALYRGIPCVTTSIGTEGLKVKDGESVFIKDQPEAFVKAIDTLLTDKNTWEKLKTNSREIARQYYTWEAVLENIERAIND